LSGQIVEMVELPVAVRRMMPGDVIGKADIQVSRLRASAVRGEVARSPAQAIGMQMRHPVGPGAPLLMADLGRPLMVQKGDPVQMELQTAGLQLSAQGIAIDSGAMGERVRVLNSSSRAVLDAEVEGSGRVRISGTTPTILAPGAPMPVRLAAR
jgi:flagella basal body P-ring formation protein FlgA